KLREQHAEFITSYKKLILGNFKPTISEDSALDNQSVIIPVQVLVNNSQLTIPDGHSKSYIMIFAWENQTD
ncbi:4778_t:CDS:2, partial [Ambispora leptoticha]